MENRALSKQIPYADCGWIEASA